MIGNDTGDERVIIVTGAARGIGFGIAKCFAERGAHVVVADVDGDGAEAAAKTLAADGAPEAMGLACDISCRAQVQAMIDDTVRRFDRLDVLVNNAGVCPFVHVMEMTPDVWQRTIDVNLTGAFHGIQLAARHMIERGHGGRIVSITSLAENVTGPAQGDYAASKAGLRMLTLAFATALGRHGITCNAVAPGMILTPMTAHHWGKPENEKSLKARVPVGRIGTPEDIGRACVFLASPDAAYVNGITLRVDGGHQAVCA